MLLLSLSSLGPDLPFLSVRVTTSGRMILRRPRPPRLAPGGGGGCGGGTCTLLLLPEADHHHLRRRLGRPPTPRSPSSSSSSGQLLLPRRRVLPWLMPWLPRSSRGGGAAPAAPCQHRTGQTPSSSYLTFRETTAAAAATSGMTATTIMEKLSLLAPAVLVLLCDRPIYIYVTR